MRDHLLLALLLGVTITHSQGCTPAPRTTPVAPPAVASPPAVAPPAVPPPPVPGSREMSDAMAALKDGDRDLATAKLEAVLVMGSRTPSRDEALFALGVIEALPDNPARDVTRARTLLQDVTITSAAVSRREASKLILSLLAREEELERSAAELRAQIEASKAESDEVRATLAQRESELRKIKEILLGKSPGP